MKSIINDHIKIRLNDFFTTPIVQHALFWMAFLFALIIMDSGTFGFFFTFLYECINVFFFAAIVYFNYNYLIINYLENKQLGTYFGLAIASTLIITPIKVIVFYFLFSNEPAIQAQLLSDRNWYFVLHFAVLVTSTVVKIATDWVKHQRERQELQTQTMQSELRFLKSQINPHFLFNTLNSLYALTLKKSDKAPEIVLKLSEMMRYMLYECNEKQVLLSKEINYIQNYLDLEKIRQQKEVDISFDIKGEIGDQKIAPLMFIPFLENCFKHGLSNRIAYGFVHILMDIEAKQVHLFIENSKPEITSTQEIRRSGGIGLENVRRRLDLLYPNQYQLNIQNNPKTYIVNLRLNIENE